VINKVLERLSDHVGRRRFLESAIKASVVLASSILGIETATAQGQACCSLLNPSDPNCSGNCCWCWNCCNSGGNQKRYQCKECWTSGCNDQSCNQCCGLTQCRAGINQYNIDCGRESHPNCSAALCYGTAC